MVENCKPWCPSGNPAWVNEMPSYGPPIEDLIVGLWARRRAILQYGTGFWETRSLWDPRVIKLENISPHAWLRVASEEMTDRCHFTTSIICLYLEFHLYSHLPFCGTLLSLLCANTLEPLLRTTQPVMKHTHTEVHNIHMSGWKCNVLLTPIANQLGTL